MAGQMIGRFEILNELGKGGQGSVYLARDSQLNRLVAIKTLRRFNHHTDQLIHEALIVSQLQHPNIITLHDAGQHQGMPYLVYAYVEGNSLAQLLKQDKILPFMRAAEIACDILEGLACAHSQGIAHLDIKPANIMIARNGIAMVMDFGLATTSNTHQHTDTGMLSGTPRYVAPEMISGQPGSPLSDIYAIGAVLYEMVTGQYAVSGENLYEVLNRAAHEQITAPSSHNESVDEKLETIILKALSKNPADRYQSASAMVNELHRYLNESRSATTEFLLQRMRSKRDFPAISGVISEINKIISSDSKDASQLTSVILQDMALTNKILRVVNTAAFRRHGTINTISKAVVVLGFSGVRNIAMTLSMLELLQHQPQADQLKDEIIRSLLVGTVAKQLPTHHQDSDMEEVQVCAMFHGLGKILSLYYFYEESQEIARLTRLGESEEVASARVLGIPYSELGLSVARSWHFPPRLLSGMRHLPRGKVSPPKGEMDQLTATINLASDLCDMSASSDLRNKQQQLTELAERYSNVVGVSFEELSSALDAGLAEIDNRANMLGISATSSPLLTRARRWNGRPLAQPPTPKTDDMAGMTGLDEAVAQKHGESDAVTIALNPDAILSAGIQDVTNTMVGEFNLNDVLQMVLETMHRGMGFHHTILLIRNNKHATMEARFGLGPGINEMIPKFHFALRFLPDVFHLAVEKGLDISIKDLRALNIADKIPGWYRETINAPSFILLPLTLDNIVVGMIYADMKEANQLDITHQQLSLLRTLRNQAVMAIKHKK